MGTRCAGGAPSWGNATGAASPPLPAVNGTLTSKAPYNSTGRSFGMLISEEWSFSLIVLQ